MAKKAEAQLLLKIKTEGQKALQSVGETFQELKGKAAVAFAAITAAIGYSINAYAESERAVYSLNSALKAQGLDVDRLSMHYQRLASAIQEKTTVDGDSLVAAIAVGQSLAGQVALTDDLVRATVDFAQATGTDLETAFRKVGQSIGTESNALARYGVELDKSYSATTKMAVVTEVLTSKFDGMAAAQANGLGSLKQLNNAFGDLVEAIGEQFAPYVEKAARFLTSFIQKLQDEEYARWTAIILGAGAAISALVVAVGTAISLLPILGSILTVLSSGFTALLGPVGLVLAAIGGLVVAWEKDIFSLQETTFGVIEALKTLFLSFSKNIGDVFTNLGELLKAAFTFDAKGAQDAYLALKDTIVSVLNETTEAYKRGHDERQALIVETAKKEKEESEKTNREVLKQAKDTQKKISDSEMTHVGLSKEERLKAEDEVSAKKRKEIQKIQEEEQKALDQSRQDFENKWRDVANGITTFANDGLRGITQSFLESFVNRFLPGFGDAVGAIFKKMSSDTEEFRVMLEDMFSQDFLLNIYKNFLFLLEKLPGFIEDIMNFTTEHMPEITKGLIEAIISAMPEIVSAIAKNMTALMADPKFLAEMAGAVASGIVAGIKNVAGDASEAVRKAFADIFGEWQRMFQRLDDIRRGGGGGGGGIFNRAVSSVQQGFNDLGLPGFSTGGLVPRLAGGGLVDNTLAMLTPGEMVVNKDSTSANMDLLQAINNSNGRRVEPSGGITIVVNGGLLADERGAREFALIVDEQLYKLRQNRESRAFDTGLR